FVTGGAMARDVVRLVSLFYTAGAEQAVDWRPATDVYRVPEGWLVKFELAGVRPEDVELTARGAALRVRGRRRDLCLEPGCRQLHMEIAYSRFERQVELPGDLQKAKIDTEFRDGMLLVRIQREADA
ncbi:MAG TPA: Hsp20/alpha crystallin family protein, partial [Gemmataceae bacterium]|nr:Hsp20/alpha crystallin family protein [Gemmataceae bacterium]